MVIRQAKFIQRPVIPVEQACRRGGVDKILPEVTGYGKRVTGGIGQARVGINGVTIVPGERARVTKRRVCLGIIDPGVDLQFSADRCPGLVAVQRQPVVTVAGGIVEVTVITRRKIVPLRGGAAVQAQGVLLVDAPAVEVFLQVAPDVAGLQGGGPAVELSCRKVAVPVRDEQFGDGRQRLVGAGGFGIGEVTFAEEALFEADVVRAAHPGLVKQVGPGAER
jgi:hypothetical protein